MASNNEIGIMDLPYAIHAHIYKKLPLKAIRSMALTNKHMLHTYENINTRKMDKIAFNSKYDRFENYEMHKELKEIILDLFDTDSTYEQSIKFCLNQDLIETIKLRSIIHDNYKYANVPYAHLEHLSHVEISLLTQNDIHTDYLQPIIECTNALKFIKYENGTLTRDSMMQITRNEKLKVLKLQNVTIHNILAFRTLLTKIKNIEVFHYGNFHFEQLMIVIKTLESIFDLAMKLPKLQDIKISAWQELNIDTIRETRLYELTFDNFHLEKGDSASFFAAILPLLNQYGVNSFEIFYVNHNYPDALQEKANIHYKLIDACLFTVKAYKYGTDNN